MPQFILDHGSTEGAKAFNTLDSFTQGYIEAAFFTETGSADDAENGLEDAAFDELASEAVASAVADCNQFCSDNAAALDQAMADTGDVCETLKRAGRDFWYTRNGHGVGFWDGDWPEPQATILTDACRAWGGVYMYRGDDDRIYFE